MSDVSLDSYRFSHPQQQLKTYIRARTFGPASRGAARVARRRTRPVASALRVLPHLPSSLSGVSNAMDEVDNGMKHRLRKAVMYVAIGNPPRPARLGISGTAVLVCWRRAVSVHCTFTTSPRAPGEVRCFAVRLFVDAVQGQKAWSTCARGWP